MSLCSYMTLMSNFFSQFMSRLRSSSCNLSVTSETFIPLSLLNASVILMLVVSLSTIHLGLGHGSCSYAGGGITYSGEGSSGESYST